MGGPRARTIVVVTGCQRQGRSAECTRSTVHFDRTGPDVGVLVALADWAGGEPGIGGADCGAAVELAAARRRPAHHLAVKYRRASVTAQLATTLCATSVPTIRLTQNRAIRTRSMGILSSASSADTEMPPWRSTRA